MSSTLRSLLMLGVLLALAIPAAAAPGRAPPTGFLANLELVPAVPASAAPAEQTRAPSVPWGSRIGIAATGLLVGAGALVVGSAVAILMPPLGFVLPFATVALDVHYVQQATATAGMASDPGTRLLCGIAGLVAGALVIGAAGYAVGSVLPDTGGGGFIRIPTSVGFGLLGGIGGAIGGFQLGLVIPD